MGLYGRLVRFGFELRPIDEVAPWGDQNPTLHWFGLTDGQYWIEAGGHELLRYRDDVARRCGLARPYPEYYVARLWEDVLELVPALIEPVPEDLVPLVDGSFSGGLLHDDGDDDVNAALSFVGDHSMYLGHLLSPPDLSVWRHLVDGLDVVTVRQAVPEGEGSLFAGPSRSVTVSADDFFGAVADMDRRLFAEMDERCTELERNGAPSGVALDLHQLRVEQDQRRQWLPRALGSPIDRDWAQVRLGLEKIQAVRRAR